MIMLDFLHGLFIIDFFSFVKVVIIYIVFLHVVNFCVKNYTSLCIVLYLKKSLICNAYICICNKFVHS